MKSVATIEEIADALGIALSDARRLAKAGALVRLANGTFDVSKSLPLIVAHLKALNERCAE